jgi:hypothetical protein
MTDTESQPGREGAVQGGDVLKSCTRILNTAANAWL